MHVSEAKRVIHWQEPQFRSLRPLKQIFKTRKPGELFAPGVHRITYIATDVDGLSSRCDFTITVNAIHNNQGRHNEHFLGILLSVRLIFIDAFF